MFLRALILALATASMADAACLDATAIVKGVTFTRADGRAGFARARVGDGDGRIDIDYAMNTKTLWKDSRSTALGIYERTWGWSPGYSHYTVGGSAGLFAYRRSGEQPMPTPGTTWITTLRTTFTPYTAYLSEHFPRKERQRDKVTYSFLDAQEVTLSGCKYTAIPVELRGPSAKLIRRWMYFPDLGFGLETRMTNPESGQDQKLGLTSMKAAP